MERRKHFRVGKNKLKKKKKNLFLLALISSNQFLTGQIILGVDDTPFNLVKNGFYKAETANLGGDGPNQFWDYSDMNTTPTYQHIVKLHTLIIFVKSFYIL